MLPLILILCLCAAPIFAQVPQAKTAELHPAALRQPTISTMSRWLPAMQFRLRRSSPSACNKEIDDRHVPRHPAKIAQADLVRLVI